MKAGDAPLVAPAGGFAMSFGHAPDGVWAAPGRGNLIGEFTDYNHGSALPFALDLTTRVCASRSHAGSVAVSSSSAPGPPDAMVVASLDDLRPGSPHGWAGYVLGVVWAMREAGHRVGGLELHIDSDVPAGVGLSSSAALECSVALAVDHLYELGCSSRELALVAQRAENDYVGIPCGIMDQIASMCCVAGHGLLVDTKSLELRQVPCDPTAAGLQLLLINTQVRHDHADSAYSDRRRTCESAAALLGVEGLCDLDIDDLEGILARLPDETTRRRVRHIITEDARVRASVELLDAGDLRAIGPVLTTAHRSLRDDFEVSCAELDTAVDASLDAGAYGARMIGGGFGGCVLAVVDADRADSLAAAVTHAFARFGFAPPVVFPAAPSAGARRLA